MKIGEATLTTGIAPHTTAVLGWVRRRKRRLLEGQKKLVGNLCVNIGQGSGGGFTSCAAPTTGFNPQDIRRIVSVEDTRTFELQGDKWTAIPGSGKARKCDRCGRMHEIHATVETHAGKTHCVGPSCAKGSSVEGALKNEIASATRRKKIETELAHNRQKLADEERIWDEVAAMRPPTETIVGTFERESGGLNVTKWTMDGSYQLHHGKEPFDPVKPPKEVVDALSNSWRENQRKRLGSTRGAHTFRIIVQDLERRLANQKVTNEHVDEAEKRLVGNLCVLTGQGSGGGFARCGSAAGPVFDDRNGGKTGYVDFGRLEKTGGQAGSQPGGFYKDSKTGERWYVKFPPTEDHARNEVLGAALYEAAGIPVPRLAFVSGTPDQKLGVASRIVDGLTQDKAGLLAGTVGGVREGFGTDVWLANWDVVGLEYDNLLRAPDGRAMRVDTGGTLRYRAMGGPKGAQFGPKVLELASMRDQTRPSGRVFGKLTTAEVRESVQRVLDIPRAKIEAAVGRFGPKDEKVRANLLETLLERRRDMARQVGLTMDEGRLPDVRTMPESQTARPSVLGAFFAAVRAGVPIEEARKKIRGNLCILTGQGSGGGFVRCDTGTKFRKDREALTAHRNQTAAAIRELRQKVKEAVAKNDYAALEKLRKQVGGEKARAAAITVRGTTIANDLKKKAEAEAAALAAKKAEEEAAVLAKAAADAAAKKKADDEAAAKKKTDAEPAAKAEPKKTKLRKLERRPDEDEAAWIERVNEALDVKQQYATDHRVFAAKPEMDSLAASVDGKKTGFVVWQGERNGKPTYGLKNPETGEVHWVAKSQTIGIGINSERALAGGTFKATQLDVSPSGNVKVRAENGKEVWFPAGSITKRYDHKDGQAVWSTSAEQLGLKGIPVLGGWAGHSDEKKEAIRGQIAAVLVVEPKRKKKGVGGTQGNGPTFPAIKEKTIVHNTDSGDRHDKMYGIVNAWYKQLSGDEKDSIGAYTSSGYMEMNHYLLGERSEPELGKQVSHLLSAIRKGQGKVPDGTIFYRGDFLHADIKAAAKSFLSGQKDVELHLKNVASASLSSGTAENFGSNKGGGAENVLLRFNDRGTYVAHYSSHKSEREALFAPGKFRVVGVHEGVGTRSDGYHYHSWKPTYVIDLEPLEETSSGSYGEAETPVGTLAEAKRPVLVRTSAKRRMAPGAAAWDVVTIDREDAPPDGVKAILKRMRDLKPNKES